jgi:hypothetical protein
MLIRGEVLITLFRKYRVSLQRARVPWGLPTVACDVRPEGTLCQGHEAGQNG